MVSLTIECPWFNKQTPESSFKHGLDPIWTCLKKGDLSATLCIDPHGKKQVTKTKWLSRDGLSWSGLVVG